MHVLCLPDLRLRTPYTVLPKPNAIDQWLSSTNINSYVNLGDLPSDQVLCTIQLVTSTVCYLRDSCSSLSDNLCRKRPAAFVNIASSFMLRYQTPLGSMSLTSAALLPLWGVTMGISQIQMPPNGPALLLAFLLISDNLPTLSQMSLPKLPSGLRMQIPC